MAAMLHRGRNLFYILAIGLVALLLLTMRWLPPVVASHFDAAGVPNGWSSRPVYALLLIAIGVVLPLGMVALITRLTRAGPGGLNIPARDYWTRPENSKEAVSRVRAYMWWLGCIMVSTTLLIHWLVLAAHTRNPPRLETSVFLVVLGTVLLGVVGWTAGWYRLLRQSSSG